MEKFKEFVKKYYLKEILLILLFSLFMFALYYGKTESFLVDSGREAYLPLRILEGKLLYKDLFNVYGPISYQINAIAYSILGTNLNTLYLMGFFNSFIILFSIFFITNFFTNRKTALNVTFLVIVSCVYIKTFFNFIFPYSYAAIYALSGALLSMASGGLFIKNKKPLYLYLTFFFAGFSFANKIEYAPYFLFLFLLALGRLTILNSLKTEWKATLKATVAFFAVPVVSFGVLLVQGVSFKELFNAFKLINDIVKTPALEFFYKSYGLYFNSQFFKLSLIILGKMLLFLVPAALVLYGLNYLNKKYIKHSLLKVISNSTIFILLFVTSLLMLNTYLKIQMRFFVWIGFVCLLILVGFGVYYLVKMLKDKMFFEKINDTDKAYLFFLVSSILVSIKGLFAVGVECYGTFSLCVLLISMSVFVVRYFPLIFKKIDSELLNKTVTNLFFIVSFLIFCGTYIENIRKPLFPIRNERGTIYVKESLADVDSMIKFIQENTPKDAKIVSTPEGALINFLAERKSDDKYYYLIPVNVQLFGEEKILADFEKEPPDYFLMNNLSYECFSTGNICYYAPKICDFVNKNYSVIAMTKNSIKFYLYKKS